MLRLERSREFRGYGKRGWNSGKRQMPGKRGLCGLNVLAHSARVTNDAPAPYQHALAFRRQPIKARAPVDEQHAQCVFELLDAGRQSGLGHAAGFGGAAEVALAGERNQEFELVDHREAPVWTGKFRARNAAPRREKAVMNAAWLQARVFAEVWAPVTWSNCSESSPDIGV